MFLALDYICIETKKQQKRERERESKKTISNQGIHNVQNDF